MKIVKFILTGILFILDWRINLEIMRNRRINRIRAIYKSNPW